MADPRSYYQPFSDATTYLAAAERLNVGHALYSLVSGDRIVALEPDLSTSPLFSPPPIAVLWRPLAALPIGFVLWNVAAAAAVLAAAFYAAYWCGPAGLILTFVLIRPIAEEIALGNVAAFFPGMMILAWRWRDRWPAGALVGAMGALKLTPFALFGWLYGSPSRWRTLPGFASTVIAIVSVTLLGAGAVAVVDYARLAPAIGPSAMSLSGQSGLLWASPVALLVGTGLAAALGRWPAIAFGVGILTSVVASPSLGLSNLVPLLAVVAPLAVPAPSPSPPTQSVVRAPAVT